MDLNFFSTRMTDIASLFSLTLRSYYDVRIKSHLPLAALHRKRIYSFPIPFYIIEEFQASCNHSENRYNSAPSHALLCMASGPQGIANDKRRIGMR